MDRSKFFQAVKEQGLYRTLPQSAVSALDAILDASRGLPVEHVAYVMATAYHEVGKNLVPIRENLYYTSASRIQKVWPRRFPTIASAQPYVKAAVKLANKVYNGRLGNREGTNDGWDYRGGGWVQTTGRELYAKVSRLTGIDLVGNPELILAPATSAFALVAGLRDGFYTGKKLRDYNRASGFDYVNARAIVNNDVAANGKAIAGYARSFEKALQAAGYSATAPAPAPVPVPPVPAQPEPAPIPAPAPTPIPVSPSPVPTTPVVEGNWFSRLLAALFGGSK